MVAGYWVWEVKSLDEAKQWALRCPHPMPGVDGAVIEIRPYYTAEDFGAEYTEELQQQAQQTHATVEARGSFIQPYLFFGGRCEQALAFYAQVLGAKVQQQIRFHESPEPVPPGLLQDGFENKIMHASFTVGSTTIMASDGCNDRTGFQGFRLAYQTQTADHAKLVFAGLCEGGTVDMPLTKTFWSPLYGQCTDQFGVGWMVMVAEA